MIAAAVALSLVQVEPEPGRLFRPHEGQVAVPDVYDAGALFRESRGTLAVPAWALAVYYDDLARPAPPPAWPATPVETADTVLPAIAPAPPRAVPCPPPRP